jgi:2-C-methyl-D-erythritol 4-phosphate cytidylyltransferase
VVDTVRRVGAGRRPGGTVDRETLRALQTPQLFVRAALEEAYRRARPGGVEAENAVLVERAGHRVLLVPGTADNLKVRTMTDLLVAEALLERRR